LLKIEMMKEWEVLPLSGVDQGRLGEKIENPINGEKGGMGFERGEKIRSERERVNQIKEESRLVLFFPIDVHSGRQKRQTEESGEGF